MKKLLIAVDLQNDFISGALGTAEARKMLPRAVQKIRDFSGEVFFTLDTHGEDYLDTAEGRKLPVPHCIKGTDGWRLAPEIAALAANVPQDHIVEKPTFGSAELPARIAATFPGEELEIQLIGICTDICVISNAMILKAYFHEAAISVDSSCCAGVTPQSHATALKAMEACQLDIL